MKKTIYITITSLICIGLGNSAIADESSFFSSIFKPHFKKDFSASVGVKVWKHKYDRFDKKELGYVPNINLRYKNFLLSGSYFILGKDYTDSFKYFEGNDDANNKQFYSSNINSDRSEWDINLGYYIFPSLVVTAGYKNIDYKDTGKFSSDKYKFSYPVNNKNDIGGFTIGIAAVSPIKGQFGIYQNLVFGWMDTDKYKLAELGLIYSFSKLENVHVLEAASIHLGYRFQEFSINPYYSNNETTSGLVLGVNLSF